MIDPRAALDRFVAALETHFDAIITRRDDDDPRVDLAYERLIESFEAYDEALASEYGEVTPFVVDDDDED
jgi:hypothetical protein